MNARTSSAILFLELVWISICAPIVWACEPSELLLELPHYNSTSLYLEESPAQRPIEIQNLDYRLLTQTIYHETNTERANRKKDPLRYHMKLAHAACTHAQQMAKSGNLSHIDSKASNLRTPFDRLREIDFAPSFVSENIAETPAIQYTSGRPYYTREENSQTIVSHSHNGPPIKQHTYISFTQTLLNQWMDTRGHRRNILSKEAEFTGAACQYAGTRQDIDVLYCVQLFAK